MVEILGPLVTRLPLTDSCSIHISIHHSYIKLMYYRDTATSYLLLLKL